MKMNYYEEALKLHEKHQGKIHTELNCEINTMDDMSVVYTPGLLNLVVRLLKMKKMFIVIQQNQIQLLLSQMEQLF